MTNNTIAPTAFETREQWLVAAIAALRPLFGEAGFELPVVRVSVGWPGGRGRKDNVIGQCWHPAASTDGIGQVFISPTLDDAARILDVLAHELVHAINHRDGDNGHGKEFAKIAKAIGLTGKMTATVASEELAARLTGIAADLGDYPHAALNAGADGEDAPKKQGTRMLKVVCAAEAGEDAYTVRMTRKWLDAYGAPTCPCHGEVMEEAA